MVCLPLSVMTHLIACSTRLQRLALVFRLRHDQTRTQNYPGNLIRSCYNGLLISEQTPPSGMA
jgi:hypothetical protein